MHRLDNSKFLLFIEPELSQKSREAVNDGLVDLMQLALKDAVKGVSNYWKTDEQEKFRKGSGYMGVHKTPCGQKSTSNDYLLKNGMITNSLAVYYLQWYREAIPASEMEKLHELARSYLPNLFPTPLRC